MPPSREYCLSMGTKRFITLLPVAVLMLAGWGLFSCQQPVDEAGALLARLDPQVEEASDVSILYSDSARVKVKITGKTMRNYLEVTNPRQEFSEGVLVEFFDANQQVSSRLSARFAMRSDRAGEVVARDSVVWTSVQKQRLETDELIWDEKRKEVYTKKFAVITTPREIIYGHGFTANQDFSDARILQVEGIIAIEEGKDSLR